MDRYRSRTLLLPKTTLSIYLSSNTRRNLEEAESKKVETKDYAEWQKQRQLNIKNQKNVAPL